MSQAELLARIVALLEDAGIPHMLVGSWASSYHGAPRATQDLDLVIDPDPSSLERLLRALPQDAYYVSAEVAREALAQRTQFNVVDLETGWKIDLIVRKDRDHSREEFARRVRARLGEVETFVARAEDTILAKLEWAQKADSRQLRDAVGVLSSSASQLDWDYLERRARELGVAELLTRARELAR